MVEVVWTEPALNDLDAIADYVAIDDPVAARELVQRVFRQIDQLIAHPDSGSKPQELRGWRHRRIVEPPSRIFYRHDSDTVYVLYVPRGERPVRRASLTERDRK